MEEAQLSMLALKAGETVSVNAELKYINNIVDCEERTDEVMTKCVDEYLDKLYPECRTQDLVTFNCTDPSKGGLRLWELSKLKLNGYNKLMNVTDGCKLPCKKKIYSLKNDGIIGNTKTTPRAPTSTAIFIIRKFQNEHVYLHQEEKYYEGNQFLSDCGGAFGLFLGLSFWSCVEFIGKQLEKILSLK